MDEDARKKLNKKLVKAAGKGNLAAIEALLGAGADVNGHSGLFLKTPLTAAAWSGRTEAVKLLLERGARPDEVSIGGGTPLLDIIQYDKPSTDIIRLLLAAGANPEAAYSGKSALDYARRNKNTDYAGLLEAALSEKAARKQALAEKAAADRAAAESAAAEAERQKQMNLVTFRQQVLDRTIEEIYNFEARERITFVRRAEGAPVEAMTRQGFAELAETPGLRQAFEEHRRRGGRAEESAIFPDALGKAKALHKPGGHDV